MHFNCKTFNKSRMHYQNGNKNKMKMTEEYSEKGKISP